MDVTILIATYGDDQWRQRGDRCYEDHEERFDAPVVWYHGTGTLAESRNRAVDVADAHGYGSGWLCFVDADDFLEDGYLDVMAAAWLNTDTDVLLTPAIRYGAGADRMVFTDRHIRSMNPCPIGTLIHRDMFELAGRFWEERAWEDWSLFRRAWLRGAFVKFVPNAVYRANSDPGGRNSKVHAPAALHAEIVRSHDQWLRKVS